MPTLRCTVDFMESTWTTRELPALVGLVEYFDDPAARRPIGPDDGPALAGLDTDSFRRALAKLTSAVPPYLVDAGIEEDFLVVGVTERAMKTVGQWPSPESLAEQFVATLMTAADKSSDPAESSKLRGMAGLLGGMAKGALVAWIAGAIPHP